jgi:hypothetical protein
MLEDEGIEITTGTAINIEKILVKTDVEKLQKLSDLKYKLTPLISRNKEEQAAVYKIFDKLDKKAAEEYKPHEEVEGETIIEKGIRKGWKKITSPWYLKKVMLPSALLLLLILAGYFLKDYIMPPKPVSSKKLIRIETGRREVVIGDTVHFTAVVDSSVNAATAGIEWRFPDTVISNSLSVTKIYNDTTSAVVMAYLKNLKGVVIDSDKYSIMVLCEPPPSVTIDETDISAVPTKIANSNKKRFEPMFTNLQKIAALYL